MIMAPGAFRRLFKKDETIMRWKRARRGAGVVATAIMLTVLAATTAANAVDVQSTSPGKSADDGADPPYATAQLVKVADGTGHGTAAQTFVNSANGFSPGDDTPTDGVVASGDTVEYKLKMSFTAAKKRQVRVSWNFDEAEYLEVVSGKGSFCSPGTFVSASEGVDGSCVYTVPAGAVETLEQSIFVKAKDTRGVAVSGQKPVLTMQRIGGGAQNVPTTDPVTVVSAPAADLEVDNGGMSDNMWPAERRHNWSEDGTADGWFDLKVVGLQYKGYSSKGASTQGKWGATIDVSEFPDSTTWTMDGKTLDPVDGELHVADLSGSKRLGYSFHYKDLKAKIEPDSSYYLTINVDPDEGSFSSGDGDSALKNLGDGSEPGRGGDRDKSTANDSYGSIEGYPYKNNNWSRAIIDRYTPPLGTVFWKDLKKPYSPGHTRFDKESMTFDGAGNVSEYVDHHSHNDPGAPVASRYARDYSRNDQIAQHSEFRTLLHVAGENVTDCGSSCNVTVGDRWDSNVHYKGDLQVTLGGQPVDSSKYVVEWSENAQAYDAVAGWRADSIDGGKARSLRVKLSDELPFGSEQGAGQIDVSFVMEATAAPVDGDVKSVDVMSAGYAGSDSGDADEDYVVIVAPGKPTASTNYLVDVTDSAGHRHSDAQPGDTVSWSTIDYGGDNSLKVSNVQSSRTELTPRVVVCVYKGTINPVNDNNVWTMRVLPKSDECEYSLEFTRDAYKPDYDQDGTAILDEIRWHGTVSNLASGVPGSTLEATVDGSAVGSIPAFTVKDSSSVYYIVSRAASDAGQLKANQYKVEVNDPISFHWNVHRKARTIDGALKTVIKMPSAGDAGMTGADGSGLDGTWHEYSLGSSKFKGSIALSSEPKLDADDSTSTTIKYSTQDLNSEDPSDYTWKTWVQLTADQRRSVKAMLLESTPQDADGMSVAASSGTLTLQPTGNAEGDKYNVWIGAGRTGDSKSNVPWPDVSVTVASSIRGSVWWDDDENTHQGMGEATINGVDVDLWRTDEHGDKIGGKPIASMTTDSKGSYLFSGLHSGSYMTEVKRNKGETTGDGVQTEVKTYYGQYKPVVNTRSWNGKVKENAKDASDKIALDVDHDQAHVDFGYAKPDPRAQLNKKQTSLTCPSDVDEDCTVSWDVEIGNKGNSELPTSSIVTDVMSSSVHDVTTTAGTESAKPSGVDKVSTTGSHTLYWSSATGEAWASGYNAHGQLGTGDTENYVVPQPLEGAFKDMAAGGQHSAAISMDGKLYVWGSGELGQLGMADKATNQLASNYVDSPTQATGDDVDGKTFTAVAAGGDFTLAAMSDGGILATGHGDSTWKVLNSGVKFKQLSANGHFWVGLTEDGIVYHGAGDDLGTHDGSIVYNLDGTIMDGIVQVAVDNTGAVLALAADGHVASNVSDLANALNTLNGVTVASVSAGYDSVMIVDRAGDVWSGGWNGYGQLANGEAHDGTGIVDGRDYSINKTSVTGAKSAVMGYQHSIIIGDKLEEWGYDAYGLTASHGLEAADRLGSTETAATKGVEIPGMKGSGKAVDQTAAPVEPATESTADGLTTRTYSLPFTVYPGGKVVYHFTGKISRPAGVGSNDSTSLDTLRTEAGKLAQSAADGSPNYTASSWNALQTELSSPTATKASLQKALDALERPFVNQAWFDSVDTPYSGTPTARRLGAARPTAPDKMSTRLDGNSLDVTGNATCVTGTDAGGEDREHWFSDGTEDQCDQVGNVVPAASKAVIRGTISGRYWFDADKDGLQDPGEDSKPTNGKQKTVTLFDATGSKVQETKTDANGNYKFTDLPLDGYHVQFERVGRCKFTAKDQGDVDPSVDRSSMDSDADTESETYGLSTVTVQLTASSPVKQGVDAGWIDSTDTEVVPLIGRLPGTGGSLDWWTVIVLVGLLAAVAGIVWRAKQLADAREAAADVQSVSEETSVGDAQAEYAEEGR